jgi:alginate O-acetyltransferase complex protein AlgI
VKYMYQPLVLPLARLAAERGYGKWGTFFTTVAAPTVVVFVTVGLWHGPAWTFVLFGLMHGVYLAVNEFWRLLHRKSKSRRTAAGRVSGLSTHTRVTAYRVLTLLCVIFANVMFRADNPGDAMAIWRAMVSPDRRSILGNLPSSVMEVVAGPFLLVAFAVFLIAFMPNTQQLMGRYKPVLEWKRWRAFDQPAIALQWRPTLSWAAWTGGVLFFGVAFIMRAQSQFIYFNF